jgi:hypothetical protein
MLNFITGIIGALLLIGNIINFCPNKKHIDSNSYNQDGLSAFISSSYIEYVTLVISKWSLAWITIGVLFIKMKISTAAFFVCCSAFNSIFLGIPYLYVAIRMNLKKSIFQSTGSVLTFLILVFLISHSLK